MWDAHDPVGTGVAPLPGMSASRPPVPRPTFRPRSEPAPKAAAGEEAPKSERPSAPQETVKAYSVTPPVIRERAPTLSLEEDDIVEEAPAAAKAPSRPSSPPPPSSRTSAPPPVPSRARSSSVPPPPQSEVRALTKKHPSSSSQRVSPPIVVIPPAAAVPVDVAPISTPAPMSRPIAMKSSIPTPPQSFVVGDAPVPAATPAPVSVAPPPVSVAPPPPSTMPAPASVAPPPVVVPAPAPAPAPVAAFDPHRPSSLLDPTDVLFDSIYDMQFAETSWQAARVCAQALATALRAKAVVVHEHDLVRRELRTIAAHGAGDMDVLGSSAASDDDLVASAVLSNGKPLTMRFEGELPRIAPERLSTVGAQRSLVAVPALSWGRCIAMIEVIDADERLASRVSDAAAYVAEHLAAFLIRAAAA